MNIKRVCLLWTVVFTVCMAVMLVFAGNKTIVIADTSHGASEETADTDEKNPVVGEQKLKLEKTYGVQNQLTIVLPQGIKAENIILENNYIDRELRLSVRGQESYDFYTEESERILISGDVSPVLSATCENRNGARLKLQMNRVLEYESTLEHDNLKITWSEPKEAYDCIVIIDPKSYPSDYVETRGVSGGMDLTLQIAKLIQRKCDLDGVRLYLARSDGRESPAEDKLSLLEEVQADFYIAISVGREEADAEKYGIEGIYNEEYFIPYFGNTDLADCLTREVTVSAGNRALGIRPADEDNFLRKLEIPAAEVSVGYLTNPKEAYLLEQPEYQEKLAAGVVKAIKTVVEGKRTQQE